MLKHENEPGIVQYFIVSDEKPETPAEGPGKFFSPAEMDINIRFVDKKKLCGKPEFL